MFYNKGKFNTRCDKNAIHFFFLNNLRQPKEDLQDHLHLIKDDTPDKLKEE